MKLIKNEKCSLGKLNDTLFKMKKKKPKWNPQESALKFIHIANQTTFKASSSPPKK
jgi:hypothetical protein